MTVYDSRRGDRGRVIDGSGQEIPGVVMVDTDTGAALQYVLDANGRKVVRFDPPGCEHERFELRPDAIGRTVVHHVRPRAVIETCEVQLAMPVRVEPLSLHRGGEIVS